jgi:hypothetical protein
MEEYKLKNNHVLIVEQDINPLNPRVDFDNITTMVCFHKRYTLGDVNDLKSEYFDGWNQLKEFLESDNNIIAIKPLYLYDHSGITISTTPFSCRWDSGQIGFVYVTQEALDREGIHENKASEIIDNEVALYDSYLTGEVYKFTLYKEQVCNLGHTHKEIVNSLSGFYGDSDIFKNGIIEHIDKELLTEELCTKQK